MRLVINGKCQDHKDGGRLLVQLFDPTSGEAIEGYAFEECLSISGDDTRHKVRWRTRETLPVLQSFRIGLKLQCCDLFSFQAENWAPLDAPSIASELLGTLDFIELANTESRSRVRGCPLTE